MLSPNAQNLMRAYCFEFKLDWVQGIHFTVMEAVQELLGFSPFELVYGHTVRGPLKENWLTKEASISLLDQVSNLRSRFTRTSEWKILKPPKTKMITWYDRTARSRSFKEGRRSYAQEPFAGQILWTIPCY